MNTTPTITATQPPGEPQRSEGQDAPRLPRNGKIAKIKRNETSFRPGQINLTSLTKPTGVLKRLLFKIPSASELPSQGEVAELHGIIERLSRNNEHGQLTAFSFQDSEWEVEYTLKSQTITDEDALLSTVFLDLMSPLTDLPKLRDGFRNGAMSSWEYRVGANLLDHGNLN